MSNYVSISASAIKSESLKTTVPGTEFKQSFVSFGSGATLCFANALSGITDVVSKNYSNFYLTHKMPLDNVLEETKIEIKPLKISSAIQYGTGNFLSLLTQPGTFDILTNQPSLIFTTKPPVANNQFTIELINERYCTISYDDAMSQAYVVVAADGRCSLKRWPLIQGDENYLRYILNGNNLVLFTTISSTPKIITNYNNELRAIDFSQFLFTNIQQYALTINVRVDTTIPSFSEQTYINYDSNGVSIAPNNRINRYENMHGNYLLSRNHIEDNQYDIILLKNQTTETGEVGTFNTLGLSGSDDVTEYREYTSINHNVDQVNDNALSLSYVCYNQSFTIDPGINRFQTSETMYPFKVLNIADTTFIENGAYGAATPKYADKVYIEKTNNIDEKNTYLCTWLSYDKSTDKAVWLDRYYYPDLTTKEQALTAQIYQNTFDSYVDQLIETNLNLKLGVTENQYFDKISDFVFEPSTSYVYDRVDVDNAEFFITSNSVYSLPGYYTQINQNNGFTIGFYINQYSGPDTITLQSQFNEVEGGLKVEFTNDTVRVDVTFYSSIDGYYTASSGIVDLPGRSKNSIICHVDNNLGIIKVFLNETSIIDTSIQPLVYNVIVYGDFFVGGAPFSNSSFYVANPFLSLMPLPEEDLNLLVAKYNTIYNTYSISLPCGMRNRTDIVKHINTIGAAKYSKANTFDVYLNGLEISQTERDELMQSIKSGLTDVMPLNSVINNIKIL